MKYIAEILLFTKAQIGITVVIAVVLAGLVAGDFVLLYLMNKKRHSELTEEVNTLREHSEDLRVRLTETQKVSNTLRVRLSETEQVSEDLRVRLNETQASAAVKQPRLLIRAKEDDDDDDNVMHYNRSFRARYIQSKDDLKDWYSDIKNLILSFGGMKANMSWKWESFRMKRRTLVKLMIRGKALCVYMAQESLDVENVKVRLEDASGMASMKETPILARIKNEKTLQRVLAILNVMLGRFGLVRVDREDVDYYQPYCGTLALIKKGLIKRVVRDATTMPGRKKDAPASESEEKQDKDKPTVKEEAGFEPAERKATEASNAESEPSHVETPVKVAAAVNETPHVKEE